MSVKIGVTWEGLTRPTLARSLLSSLAPSVQASVIFLNTVWLPPYTQQVFSLKDQAQVCGIDTPSLPKLSFLHPGPTTPPTAFVPSASLKALASEVGKLLDTARERSKTDEQIKQNLLVLFSFEGLACSDVELVQLMESKTDDPLTSLTDELRLMHAKTLIQRLLHKDCRLYQVTYGPYIFLRDDSPTVWGASRLVYEPTKVSPTDVKQFFQSLAQKGKALPWYHNKVVLLEHNIVQLTKAPLEALEWRPLTRGFGFEGNEKHGNHGHHDEPLTSCFAQVGNLTISLAIAVSTGVATGTEDPSNRPTETLSDAQDLNMRVLNEDIQKYWRHTVLKRLLEDGSKRRDHRLYVLIVSSMNVEATVNALHHYAKSLQRSSQRLSLKDIVLVALDRDTLKKFAKGLKCSLHHDELPQLPLHDGLIQVLNVQAKELI